MNSVSGASGGIVGGVVSAGANAISAQLASRRQYKYTKMLQEQQNAWNEKMWNAQNEYNTPANQVQRLKDAGINPALAVSDGQLSTGQAGSAAPAAQGQFGGNSYTPVGSDFIFGMRAASDIKGQNIQNQRDLINLYVETVTKADRVKGVKAASEKLKNEADLIFKQLEAQTNNNWVQSQTMNNVVEQSQIRTETMKIERDIRQKDLDSYEERFAVSIASSWSDIRLKFCQGQLSLAEAKAALINASANALTAQAAKQNADTNSSVGNSQIRLNNSNSEYNEMKNGSIKYHGAFYETEKGKAFLRERLDNNIKDKELRNMMYGKGADGLSYFVKKLKLPKKGGKGATVVPLRPNLILS